MNRRMGRFIDDSEIFSGSPETLVNLQGWSASAELTSGIIATPSNTALVMQTTFKKLNTYTLQFTLNPLTNPTNYIQAIAEIIWSVKGNSLRRQISVTNGAAISGVGESVSVKVTDFSSNVTASRYLVSCQITPGLRGSSGQPPTFEIDNALVRGASPLQNIGATSTGTWQVPLDSGINSFFPSVAGNGFFLIPPEQISIRQSAGAAILKRTDGASLYKWIPLSPGCTNIVIANNNAFIVSANIAWGIEG